MGEYVEVQLLEFLCHDVHDDLLDEAVVLEPVDDDAAAVLLALLYVDDGVALPELLDFDDLLVLFELLYLDVLDLMLYDDVADGQFESLDALDELADVVCLDVGCQCQPLWSRCPTLLLTILDVLLDVLVRNVDVGSWEPFFFIVTFVLMIWMFFFSIFPIMKLIMMIWMLIPMMS